MMPVPYSWESFSISFYYPASVAEVFRCWATRSGLESFFIESVEIRSAAGEMRGAEEVVQAGDAYQWRWRHGPTLAGTFTEVLQNESIQLTFGEMRVKLSFTDAGDATLVRLLQDRIDDDAAGRVMGHLNCRSCWIFFMTNLKSVLLNGTDLRDGDPERVSSMEVGYEPEELG